MKDAVFDGDCKMYLRQILFFLVLYFYFVAIVSADSNIEPSLIIGRAYTDNLLLEEVNPKRDFVTRAIPGLVANTKGPRINATLSYAVEADYYDNYNEYNSIYQTLKTNAKTILIKDTLYLDLFASQSQVNLDASGKTSVDNISITNNRSDLLIYGATPKIKFKSENIGTFDASSAVTVVKYAADHKYDAAIRNDVFRLSTNEAGPTTMSFDILQNRTEVAYASNNVVVLDVLGAGMYYHPGEKTRIYLKYGIEDNSLSSLTSTLVHNSTLYRTIGIDWGSDKNNTALLEVSNKYDRQVYRMDIVRDGVHSNLEVGYQEGYSTLATQQIQFDLSGQNSTDIRPLYDIDLDKEYIYEKSSFGKLRYKLKKSYIEVGYQSKHRDSLLFHTQDRVSQNYTAIQWDVTHQTSVYLQTSKTVTDYNSTDSGDVQEIQNIDITNLIGKKSRINYTISRVSRVSVLANSNYIANVASVSLRMMF